MGTTSEKLTYLNTTKEKIRDSINLTGANLTSEDTFRSYASKLKKGYIDIINNGIDTLYNNFPKVSGIGSNLSLTPTYEAPIKLNEIQGSTLQDGTPTPDTPVPIQSVTGLQNVNVCGKNLFDINGTVTQGTLDKYNNGFTLVKGTNRVIRFVLPKVLPAGTYTLSYDVINSVHSATGDYFFINCQYGNNNTNVLQNVIINDNGTTFTTTSEFDRLYFFIAGNQSNNATITIDNVQLEQGSATSYEPYKCNTYEVNLGKNLCKEVIMQNAETIKLNANNKYLKQTFSISLIPTITISQMSVVVFADNKNLGRVGYIDLTNNTKSSATITLTDSVYKTILNATAVNFNLYKRDASIDTTSTIKEPQIENGSVTSYSPYFTPIELNKIGDYKDSIKKSTGKNIITTYNYASSGYINYNYDNSKIGKTMTYSFIPNFSTTNATLYIRANTSISSYNVGTIATITSGTKVSVTFTLTDEQYNTIKNTTGGYIQIYKSGVSMDENSISNPMLEINNQATSYEPYGKVWYLEKNIGKVVLNGSEKWFDWSNNRMVLATLTDYKKVDSSTTSLLMSNYYKAVSRANSQTNNSMCFYGNSDDSFGIIVCDGTNNTSTLLKAWLSTHNTEVLYVLATPTYTEITNTELIEDLETLYTAKSQEGTTNISITSEDLEMILNVSALKGDA